MRRNKQREQTISRNIELTQKILERLKPLERDGAISEIQILQQFNQLEAERDDYYNCKPREKSWKTTAEAEQHN